MDLKILDSRISKEDLLPQTEGSAAIDLRACIEDSVRILPYCSVRVPTGIAIWTKDPSTAGLILPRSGLGSKNGIVLGNLVGLLDSDYQGQIEVSIWNRSDDAFTIKPLDRIAQLMLLPIIRPNFNIVNDFDNLTQRGIGGFSSTGLR